MLKLSDFFQPLNFFTLSYFFGSFLLFDITGTFIRNRILKLENELYTRVLNWLLGLGFFIFLWFLLSLFITPGRTQLLISIGVLLCISFPHYLRKKAYISLLRSLWLLKVPVLLITPFLPAVFVKASLPPYYSDEMAYHFVSPSFLATLNPTKYVGYLYADAPRILDFFWQIIFTLFHTYSVARLFHFTILATSMIYTYAILKKNFGLLPAFLFVLVFFCLPQDIVFFSTLGFIDVGAFSLMLIGLVSSIDFFIDKKESSLLLAFLFWAMSLGTKYTGASNFVSFLLISSLFMVIYKKEFFKLFSKKLLIKIFLVFMVFGGYWYLKNFIAYGNPIFPFLFPCWGHYSIPCPLDSSSFFGDWTAKINLVNARFILDQLFHGDIFVQIMTIVAPVLAFFGINKKMKFMALFCFLVVVVELVILKYFSGFYLRYHQHMQLYLLLGLVLVLSNKYKDIYVQAGVKLALLGLAATSIFLFDYTLVHTYTAIINWNEINYATGKMNIYNWMDYYYPRMATFTKWCEDPPEGKRTALAIFESEGFWLYHSYRDDYYFRSFATNCYVSTPPVPSDPDKVLAYLKDQKMKFWIASISSCVPPKSVVLIDPKESGVDLLQLKINNMIICNSTEVESHLYYFDYENVK